MDAGALLLRLLACGAELSERGGKLRVRIPKGEAKELLPLAAASRDDILRMARGEAGPKPSLLSLANEYRARFGRPLREAFRDATGIDVLEENPDWIHLYAFRAWLDAQACPGGARASPRGDGR